MYDTDKFRHLPFYIDIRIGLCLFEAKEATEEVERCQLVLAACWPPAEQNSEFRADSDFNHLCVECSLATSIAQ